MKNPKLVTQTTYSKIEEKTDGILCLRIALFALKLQLHCGLKVQFLGQLEVVPVLPKEGSYYLYAITLI